MTEFEQRIANEKAIIEKLVTTLAEQGWILVGAADTEDYEELSTHEAAYEQSSCADMGSIYFKKDGKTHYVIAIYGNGNDGWDLLSDHTYNPKDDFEDSMRLVYDWIDAEQENVGAY